MLNKAATKGAEVEICNISKFYSGFTALDNVSLKIKAGEFISFLGPSGSGKTTTLNIIAGFIDNDSGSILYNGYEIDKEPAHKRNMGVVFQNYALFPHMTVAANVAYPLQRRKIAKRERERLVAEVLEKVELNSFSNRYPEELSGGQQQRVALARAMVFSPALLLMDEPLGALDKKLRESLQLEIRRIHRELGSTFIFVTHDQEEALVLSDRIAVFNKGRIEQIGTGEELYKYPKTLFVGEFIGESSVLRGPHRMVGDKTEIQIAEDEYVTIDCLPSGTKPQCILLRPEEIMVQRPQAMGADENKNRLSGQICEKIYLGNVVKYQVSLTNGTIVTARMSNDGDAFSLDEQVEVIWNSCNGTLLSDDKASG